MTLEHSFPGLRSSPGGAIVAVADNLFDLTGPVNAMTAEVLQNHARQIMAQIKAIDPGWHYDEIVPIDALGNSLQTVDGSSTKVNDLRFQRGVAVARLKGDYEPLQVETLRFVQQRADLACDRGVALLKAGRITPRLSDQEALGNHIDRQVRLNLRDRYNVLGIDSVGAGPVRVNRRENNSSGSDLTYRLPDARVKDVAFDVTLTRKTLSTSQVRGFFEAEPRDHYPPKTNRSRSHLRHFTPGDPTMSSPFFDPRPYVPGSLSEIHDLLGSMVLDAPTFVDPLDDFPKRNIHNIFHMLVEGLGVVRNKLGEQSYATLLDLAKRAKALFAADHDDTNGNTDLGRALLFEMEDVLRDVRNRRTKEKLPDEDGEITGD